MKKPDKSTSKRSLAEVEDETFARVNRALSVIEIALSAWEHSKEKPKSFEKRVDHLRSSHSLLSSWARKSLSGKKDSVSVSYRLMDFAEMCKEIENSRVA